MALCGTLQSLFRAVATDVCLPENNSQVVLFTPELQREALTLRCLLVLFANHPVNLSMASLNKQKNEGLHALSDAA